MHTVHVYTDNKKCNKCLKGVLSNTTECQSTDANGPPYKEISLYMHDPNGVSL